MAVFRECASILRRNPASGEDMSGDRLLTRFLNLSNGLLMANDIEPPFGVVRIQSTVAVCAGLQRLRVRHEKLL